MNINFFQISILLISIVIIIYIWHKSRLISNFLLGALILIALSCLNFLDFKGHLDTISITYMIFSFILLNATMWIKNKRKSYIYSIVSFILITFILFVLTDPGEYYEYKLGIVVRIFLSFFPINWFFLSKKKE
jgi:uncharacterized membrane protein YccC